MKRLQGKRAIITGGNKGIGEAIATAFAREGADIIITYVSDAAGAQANIKKIEQFGGKVKAIKFDLRLADDAENLVTQAVEYLGGVDILVNNAFFIAEKFADYRPFLEISEEAIQNHIDANLFGPIRITQKICKQMVAQKSGGCIINISSTADKIPSRHTNRVAYEVSKAGITMLTRSLGLGMAQYGIRVNAIAPGLTDTPIIQNVYKDVRKDDMAWNAIVSRFPIGRIGVPSDYEEIAIAMVLSQFMTGETIVVDGGGSLGAPTQEAFEKAQQFWLKTETVE